MAIVESIESPGGARRLRVSSPVTGEEIGVVPVTAAAEVRAAVARARAAQPAWAAAGFDERAKVMRRALKILLRRQEELIDVLVRETGRSRVETIILEIFPACDTLSYHAKHAKRILADHRAPLHLLRTKKLVVTYRPLGVVGIITPWNGPFILSLNPSVQALMAGNAVVLKPSEVTPFAGRLVAELFREAGLPEGVLTLVEGDGETGAALVDAGVDKISFTGSVRTGRKVGEACGRNLIPCTLELGGKDPMIVCADADIERAAGGALFGAFFNAGQYCCATERVYVVESVADALTARIVEKTRALRQGKEGEFDVGPMIWPRQIEVIERHMADARAKGAKVLTGGRRNTALGDLFYEPTVLTDVTHDMLIMQEETFGPILPIVRVRDEEEAIRLANDSVVRARRQRVDARRREGHGHRAAARVGLDLRQRLRRDVRRAGGAVRRPQVERRGPGERRGGAPRLLLRDARRLRSLQAEGGAGLVPVHGRQGQAPPEDHQVGLGDAARRSPRVEGAWDEDHRRSRSVRGQRGVRELGARGLRPRRAERDAGARRDPWARAGRQGPARGEALPAGRALGGGGPLRRLTPPGARRRPRARPRAPRGASSIRTPRRTTLASTWTKVRPPAHSA